MKTIQQQYDETKAELHRCKPRSERRTIVENRLVNLKLRLIRLELRKVSK